VQRPGERRHEGPPHGSTAEVGHVDHAGERLAGKQVPEGGSLARGEGDVGVPATEHHHGTGRGREAIGAQAQAPPHAERVDDADASSPVHQPLDQGLGGVGLARPRRAHDGHPLLQHSRG
jgi:hypothetical protein